MDEYKHARKLKELEDYQTRRLADIAMRKKKRRGNYVMSGDQLGQLAGAAIMSFAGSAERKRRKQ